MNATMETTSLHVASNEVNTASERTNAAARFWERMEANRFGVTPMLLTVVVCIGGLAAALVINESAYKLLAIAVSTTFAEALILAVMPMRTILIAAAVCVAISLLVIII